MLKGKVKGIYLRGGVFWYARQRSTLMTSNRPIEEWGKLLSDVPAASAILDRLLHHAEVIAITGRSYRLQDSANQRLSPKPKSSLTASTDK